MKKLFMLLAYVSVAVALLSSLCPVAAEAAEKNPKMGFIFFYDEHSNYDANFMAAAEQACREQGVECIFRKSVPESEECAKIAAELAQEGCRVVFADSFGHDAYMAEAAKKFPAVDFITATGVKSHTAGLPNYHNAFATIYEGRYLTGIAAGLKLNEMIAAGKISPDKAKIGYVGAFTYPEVISGYTAFFLGARSVCKTATMDVLFTGAWYDYDKEKQAAAQLAAGGAVLLGQHSDSMGVPSFCEANNIPDVAYNDSLEKECPKTFLLSCKINWVPYFTNIIDSVKNGKAIARDWTGNMADGSIEVSAINERVAAKGTAKALAKAKQKLSSGKVHVFDARKFTVNGAKLESFAAAISEGDEREALKDGYFHESEYRSAPYFDLTIDGVTLLNTAY